MTDAPRDAETGETAGADVVVVGGGGAGLAAAIAARDSGASVILLEKNDALGGSTAWSVGALTASGTPHQRRAGIVDDADQHFKDMAVITGSLAPHDNLALRRILVEGAGATLEWLMTLGLVFVGPMPEPPHRHDRMHNVLPNSKAFPYRLGRRAARRGVDIRLSVTVTDLVLRDGAVVGVRAADRGGRAHVVQARRAVVLAAGDFSAGADLKAHFAGPDMAEIDAINPTATGDGLRIALRIGAEVLNGKIIRGPIMRFVPPPGGQLVQKLPPWRLLARLMKLALAYAPQRLLRPFFMRFITTALGPSPDLFAAGAILVNRRGERFTVETASPNGDVARQPERLAWIVFDRTLAEKFSSWPHIISTAPGVAYAYLPDYRKTRPDIYHEASTPAALADSIGVPRLALEQTLAAYNRSERGERPALATPPYYALGPAKAYIVFTDGGLRVSERLEVLKDGAPIPGLYAAGSNGQGGLLLEGHGHHLMWAFTSGRIAGRNAAQRRA